MDAIRESKLPDFLLPSALSLLLKRKLSASIKAELARKAQMKNLLYGAPIVCKVGDNGVRDEAAVALLQYLRDCYGSTSVAPPAYMHKRPTTGPTSTSPGTRWTSGTVAGFEDDGSVAPVTASAYRSRMNETLGSHHYRTASPVRRPTLFRSARTHKTATEGIVSPPPGNRSSASENDDVTTEFNYEATSTGKWGGVAPIPLTSKKFVAPPIARDRVYSRDSTLVQSRMRAEAEVEQQREEFREILLPHWEQKQRQWQRKVRELEKREQERSEKLAGLKWYEKKRLAEKERQLEAEKRAQRRANRGLPSKRSVFSGSGTVASTRSRTTAQKS